MRVTTALNRLLALAGASVKGVTLTGEGVIVRVRLRRRRIACSVCGQAYRSMHGDPNARTVEDEDLEAAPLGLLERKVQEKFSALLFFLPSSTPARAGRPGRSP